MDRKILVSLWYFIMAVLVMYYLQNYVLDHAPPESISYSEMIHLLESGQVAAIEVNEQYIRGQLKSARPGGSTRVVTARMDVELAKLLAQYDVEYKGIIESHLFATLLSWIMLGETLPLLGWPGMAIAGLGVMLATRKPRRVNSSMRRTASVVLPDFFQPAMPIIGGVLGGRELVMRSRPLRRRRCGSVDQVTQLLQFSGRVGVEERIDTA